MRISSIKVSTQKLHISTSCHVCNKTYRRKSIMECLLSSKRRDSECFPVSNGVCAAFLSRRASRNCRKGLEEMLLDRVENKSSIFDFPPFCLCNSLTGSEVLLLFCNTREIYWACAGKKVFSVSASLYIYIYFATDIPVNVKLCMLIALIV